MLKTNPNERPARSLDHIVDIRLEEKNLKVAIEFE